MPKIKGSYDLGIYDWISQGSINSAQQLMRHLNLLGIGIIHEISSLAQVSKVHQRLKKINSWSNHDSLEQGKKQIIFHNLLIKNGDYLKQSGIKRILAEFRSRVEIITMECTTPSLTKWALNDRRIDILTFPPTLVKNLVDSATARLAKEHEKHVELPLRTLISIAPNERITTFRQYIEVLQRLRKKESPIVVTSRAKNPLELRNVVQTRALLKVFGFTDDETKKIVKDNPRMILQRNLEKLRPEYLLPGVKAVRIEEVVSEMLTQAQSDKDMEE